MLLNPIAISRCLLDTLFGRSLKFKKLESARWILENGNSHIRLGFFEQFAVLETGDMSFIKAYFADRMEGLQEETVHYAGNPLYPKIKYSIAHHLAILSFEIDP